MHESKISRAVCCKNCCKRCQKCQREIVQLENIQILSVTDATVRYTFWHLIFRTATTKFLQQRHHFILKSAIHLKKKGIPRTVSAKMKRDSNYVLYWMASFSFTLTVRDSADKPPEHTHPSHHVCFLWSHAACRKPTKRHCVQLWTFENQRHG